METLVHRLGIPPGYGPGQIASDLVMVVIITIDPESSHLAFSNKSNHFITNKQARRSRRQ